MNNSIYRHIHVLSKRFPTDDNRRAYPPPRYMLPGVDTGQEFRGNNGQEFFEGYMEHNMDTLPNKVNCPPRPQTTGDVPRISVTQAVQNSLRK